VVSGYLDNTLKVWDVQSGALKPLLGHALLEQITQQHTDPQSNWYRGISWDKPAFWTVFLVWAMLVMTDRITTQLRPDWKIYGLSIMSEGYGLLGRSQCHIVLPLF